MAETQAEFPIGLLLIYPQRQRGQPRITSTIWGFSSRPLPPLCPHDHDCLSANLGHSIRFPPPFCSDFIYGRPQRRRPRMDSCCAHFPPSFLRWMDGAALHFGLRRDFRRRCRSRRVRQMMHFPRAKLGNEALLPPSLSLSLCRTLSSRDKWMENELRGGGEWSLGK